MTQRELNRAIARATGESVHDIAHLGFVPLTPTPIEREPIDHDPVEPSIDWDEFDLLRNVALIEQRRGVAFA